MAKTKNLENLRHEATRLFTDLQRNFPYTREILLTGCAGKEVCPRLRLHWRVRWSANERHVFC